MKNHSDTCLMQLFEALCPLAFWCSEELALGPELSPLGPFLLRAQRTRCCFAAGSLGVGLSSLRRLALSLLFHPGDACASGMGPSTMCLNGAFPALSPFPPQEATLGLGWAARLHPLRPPVLLPGCAQVGPLSPHS